MGLVPLGFLLELEAQMLELIGGKPKETENVLSLVFSPSLLYCSHRDTKYQL